MVFRSTCIRLESTLASISYCLRVLVCACLAQQIEFCLKDLSLNLTCSYIVAIMISAKICIVLLRVLYLTVMVWISFLYLLGFLMLNRCEILLKAAGNFNICSHI